MTAVADIEAGARGRALAGRGALIASALLVVFLVALFAGARFGLLLAIGLGFGMVLEGFRFGFAGPWRALITRREASGTLAQLLSIALVSVVAFPMIQSAGGSVIGAHAPVGWAMIGGAFVFGAAMQVVMGCGSGTLVNAGSGNPVSLLALPFFALGSFAGATHLFWWTGLGTLPTITFDGEGGLLITLGLLAVAAICVAAAGKPGKRTIPPRLWIAAGLLAALALGNLAVAGQPWGVVYGLGLWAAKGAAALGADLSGSAFWAAPVHQTRLAQSLLTDVTSLTNLGIVAGAFGVAAWRGGLSASLPALPGRAWLAVVVAGFLLGYSSRLAFGCNVGAFFSGISTGSLHGWAWFVAAFGGAFLGIRLRPALGLEPRA
jgi:hypothetical protein